MGQLSGVGQLGYVSLFSKTASWGYMCALCKWVESYLTSHMQHCFWSYRILHTQIHFYLVLLVTHHKLLTFKKEVKTESKSFSESFSASAAWWFYCHHWVPLHNLYTTMLIGLLCSSEYNSRFTQGEHLYDPSSVIQKWTDSMKHKCSDATAADLFLRSQANLEEILMAVRTQRMDRFLVQVVKSVVFLGHMNCCNDVWTRLPLNLRWLLSESGVT